MAHQGIPIVCGGLILLLGLTPFSANGQTTANPSPPERQGVADQPTVVPSDRADLSTGNVSDLESLCEEETDRRLDAEDEYHAGPSAN